ncbi:hypothetical protein GY26_04585 [Gammaproteobacteria bacterium MFB021]|nr:hypothetical protein GY26_04585 [Gammaproteobacteria bacterium MFB021]
MSAWGVSVLALVALAVVVGLALYARRLWREVRRRETFRRDEIARANRNCIDSLAAISQAMLERQVDLVEGALRCKVLLDIVDHQLVTQERFKVIAEVQAQAAHLRTHAARSELTPRQRHREDLARVAIAEQYETRLDDAARALRTLCADWPDRGAAITQAA